MRQPKGAHVCWCERLVIEPGSPAVWTCRGRSFHCMGSTRYSARCPSWAISCWGGKGKGSSPSGPVSPAASQTRRSASILPPRCPRALYGASSICLQAAAERTASHGHARNEAYTSIWWNLRLPTPTLSRGNETAWQLLERQVVPPLRPDVCTTEPVSLCTADHLGPTRCPKPAGLGVGSVVGWRSRLTGIAYAESLNHEWVGHDWAARAGRMLRDARDGSRR